MRWDHLPTSTQQTKQSEEPKSSLLRLSHLTSTLFRSVHSQFSLSNNQKKQPAKETKLVTFLNHSCKLWYRPRTVTNKTSNNISNKYSRTRCHSKVSSLKTASNFTKTPTLNTRDNSRTAQDWVSAQADFSTKKSSSSSNSRENLMRRPGTSRLRNCSTSLKVQLIR